VDQVMSWIAGFKKFLLRGNIVELAIAFVIGGAFAAVVTSFVTNMITPLLAIPGNTDFQALTFSIGGGIFKYGAFINSVVAFVGIAAAVYFVVVKPMEVIEARRAASPGPPTTRACPECLSDIPVKATRCAFCTAQVTPTA
jgi:large conductance mechanosensitive channel